MREFRKKYGSLFFCILVTIAVIAVTAWSSSQTGAVSGGNSRNLVRKILKFLSVDYTSAMLSRYDHLLRKAAHFILYFILGCSLTGIYCRQKRVPTVLAVIPTGAVLAALDEFHQKFSDGRSPMVTDVLLDTCGVAAGCFLVTVVLYCMGRKTRK